MKANIDEIANTLGLPTWEKWSENFEYFDTYHHAKERAKQEALDEGESEEEAETAGEKAGEEAEQEEQTEDFNKYYDNLMHVAEQVFEQHGLKLVPADAPGTEPGWKMTPDLDGLRKKRRR